MDLRSDVLNQDFCALALPKGKSLICAVCSAKARYICKKCKAVYYCSKHHREKDWNVIHHEICDHIEVITAPRVALDAETRARFQAQVKFKQKEIIAIIIAAAKKSLFEGHKEAAFRQILTGLKFAEDFALNMLDKVEIYCMAVEALTALGKADEATQEMTKLLWLLQDPEFVEICPPEVKADIYKNEGLLNVSRQDYSAALISHANEVLYASEAHDTEHIRTAAGYFNLGHVFQLQGRHQLAFSHYLHAVEIWTTRFGEIFNRMIQKAPPLNETKAMNLSITEDPEDTISEEERRAGQWYLDQIAAHTAHTALDGHWRLSPADSGRVLVARALLCYVTDRYEEARAFASRVKADPDNDPSRIVISKAKLIYTRCLQKKTRENLLRKTSVNPSLMRRLTPIPKDVTESTSICNSVSSKAALDASKELVIGYEFILNNTSDSLKSDTSSDQTLSGSDQSSATHTSLLQGLDQSTIKRLSNSAPSSMKGFARLFELDESIAEEPPDSEELKDSVSQSDNHHRKHSRSHSRRSSNKGSNQRLA